ncbi:cysteine hydrolase family protein [Aquibacillus albus]|uniref:Ureidoacrylate peracid hydrolase n=1 Tax=Aquibacillus albus TaxID=1168171 RepID=A0ABS2MWF3_9BACI|nr:isochorismatase family cysteine hydrolase [Aquibacillus albus]MBM7570221.1 ureidoacrylate peracid hydrolase [Aquibacillus albus]
MAITKKPIKFAINLKRSAVVVVDMQNVFAHPDGTIFVEATKKIVPKIQDLTKVAKQAGVPIIYLRHVVQGDGTDTGRMKDIVPNIDQMLQNGSWNVEIINSLTPEVDDIIVDKPFFGGFTGTDLDTILRGKDIDTIIISGTLTNICCETTARQAVEREYKVIFLSDGTAAGDKPDMGWGPVSAELNQQVTLINLASTFCQVSPTNQIVSEIKENSKLLTT